MLTNNSNSDFSIMKLDKEFCRKDHSPAYISAAMKLWAMVKLHQESSIKFGPSNGGEYSCLQTNFMKFKRI